MTKDDEANQGQGMPPQVGDPSTSAMVPMPAPALPEYIEQAMPPPSYEEIMGHQTQTSVQQTVTELPPLAYVDIMPRLLKNGNIKYKIAPEFDKFRLVYLFYFIFIFYKLFFFSFIMSNIICYNCEIFPERNILL